MGAVDAESAQRAARHFESVGMKTRMLSSPEATELAKLTETTYFGLIIAWTQEVERYCDQLGVNYDEIVSIYEEVPFFPPVKYFPGVIGGHCVMSNIEILNRLDRSDILKAIESSNKQKVAREGRGGSREAGGEGPEPRNGVHRVRRHRGDDLLQCRAPRGHLT